MLISRSEDTRGQVTPPRRVIRGGGARIWMLCAALAVASSTDPVAINAVDSAAAGLQTKQQRQARTRVVARWHMDERSGRLMHDAAGSHDGELRQVRLGRPGLAGTAYGFNGSSSYVSIPSAPYLNPHRKRIVITMHLRTKRAPAKPDWDLIRKGRHTTRGGEYLMEYYPSGRASCAFKGSIRRSQVFARPRLNDGRWHMVKCVKTRSHIKVVVDGRRFPKRVRVGKIANGARVVVGARPGSEFFTGSLDEARIRIG